MHIEFKITAWERVDVPEHLEKEVMAKIKSGEIHGINCLHEQYGDVIWEWKQITESEAYMKVGENNDKSTVYVCSENEEGKDVIDYKNGR